MARLTLAWCLGLGCLLVIPGCGGGGGGADAGQDAGELDSGREPDAGELDSGREPDGETDAGAGCPTLPSRIEEDTSVGPECVRIERTQVEGGVTLTIAAGTRVEFAGAGYLAVLGDGALVAVGTESEPVLFTSEAASPLAGDWQCIRIGSGSSGTDLRHAVLEYGGQPCEATGADYEAMLDLAGAARAVSNLTFRHSQTHAVLFQHDAAVRGFAGNVFSDNAEASILMHASELLTLGTGHTFEDADDFIEVDTTFHLQSTGTLAEQPVPYRMIGKLDISGGAEVTLEGGVVLQMSGQSIEVFNSNMIIAGTADAPVTITSAQRNPIAGDWGCIWYTVTTGTPRIDHAVIEYGGSGAACSGARYRAAVVVPAEAMITNTTFRNVAGAAIKSLRTCNTTQWCTNDFESVATGPLECSSSHTPTGCP